MPMQAGFLNNGKGLGETRYKTIYVTQKNAYLPKVVTVSPDDTIGGWKSAVAACIKGLHGMEHLFALEYGGELLNEHRAALEYEIPEDSTLLVISKAPIVANKTCIETLPAEATREHAVKKECSVTLPSATQDQHAEDKSTAPSDGDAGSLESVEAKAVNTKKSTRRDRQKRVKAREAEAEAKLAAEKAAARHSEEASIRKGSKLIVREKCCIYKAPNSWTIVGHVAAGQKVEASGPVEVVQGFSMVKLKQRGAVEIRYLDKSLL